MSSSQRQEGRIRKIMYFLYNRRTGKVMNRTLTSWIQLFLFYVVFYVTLAAIWTTALAIFLQTLNAQHPKWYNGASVMATDRGNGWGPGVNYQPQLRPDAMLISVGAIARDGEKPLTDRQLSNNDYAERLRAIISKYEAPPPLNAHCVDCSQQPPQDDADTCAFNVTYITQHCNDTNGFGYYDSKPCVFLALNKIYAWEAEPFDSIVSLPDDLKQYLGSQNLTYNSQNIYFTCYGDADDDKKNIGSVTMMPVDGISRNYFNYKNQIGFLPPLAAVRFESIQQSNLIVNVICRAFGKNIPYNADSRLGATRFQIMLRS